MLVYSEQLEAARTEILPVDAWTLSFLLSVYRSRSGHPLPGRGLESNRSMWSEWSPPAGSSGRSRYGNRGCLLRLSP